MPDAGMKKLGDRAIEMLFLGLTPGVKGYRLWNPRTSQVTYSVNPVFLDRSGFDRHNQGGLVTHENPSPNEYADVQIDSNSDSDDQGEVDTMYE